jgi:hypothetical protein
LSEQLFSVIEDYSITSTIFTVTQDNTSNNTTMLAVYKKACYKKPTDQLLHTQQLYPFNIKEGDICCIAYIINLAVQAALSLLKAIPEENSEVYRDKPDTARLSLLSQGINAATALLSQGINTATALLKLQKHIYIFCNRLVWRDTLNTQVIAASIKPKALVLDIPVYWNSIYKMLEAALVLQTPIIAVCTTQTLDISIQDILLTEPD